MLMRSISSPPKPACGLPELVTVLEVVVVDGELGPKSARSKCALRTPMSCTTIRNLPPPSLAMVYLIRRSRISERFFGSSPHVIDSMLIPELKLPVMPRILMFGFAFSIIEATMRYGKAVRTTA